MYRQALLAAALFTGAAEPPPSTGRIEGTVRDSAGVPVANAQVIVVSRPWTAMSDSLGRFRLADIPAGRYTIQVSAIGYGRQRGDRRVRHRRSDDSARPHAEALHCGRGRRPDRSRQAGGGRLAGDVADGSDGRARPPMGRSTPRPSRSTPRTTRTSRRTASCRPAPTRSPPSPSTWTARSYSNVRRFLTRRAARPPRDAVRIEELVNYFPLRLPASRAASTRSPSPPRSRPAPWNAGAPAGAHRPAGAARRHRASCRRATWSSSSTSPARCSRRTSCRW